MQQDIRDLFKKKDDLKTLPKNHRTEFLDKLKVQSGSRPSTYLWLKIAAVLVVSLAVTFTIFESNNITDQPKVEPIIAQIEQVEAQYLADIEKEWDSFVKLAEDAILVERFRNKLDDLDADYKEISVQFKNDTNNILVIEALVDNLQTRLQILKDIQEHINILNQKTEQYETTI